MNWSASDYDTLRELTFAPDYPHKPKPEIPNGDGLVDTGKQYRHVAMKYLMKASYRYQRALLPYLMRAHDLSLQVAAAFGLPREAWPKLNACALRVLEYPAGVGGHRHTDFDLFTLNLWRNPPKALRTTAPLLRPEVHVGELCEMLGVGKACEHWVEPCAEAQQSLVYFALPNPELVLPSGLTAGAWLAERYARSRA